MAGYIFTMDSIESIVECFEKGVYSTYVSPRWGKIKYATFADYLAMKPGDNVYFFTERMVYGIGEIVNFADSTTVINNYPSIQSNVVNTKHTTLNPAPAREDNKVRQWVIRFVPSPYFYKQGIDMDTLLESDPSAFRSLRVFSSKSFIKFDDKENNAFRAALFRANFREDTDTPPEVIHSNPENTLEQITSRLTKYRESLLSRKTSVKPVLESRRQPDGSSSAEMLVEAGLLEQLTQASPEAEQVFGHWDYLSHQVAASPLKPVQYMDFIDVFGYRWIPDIPDKVINKYLIVEIKKGILTGLDCEEATAQVMKYVDWVCDNYAHGDYSQIKAFLIAHDFEEAPANVSNSIIRNYTINHRPVQTAQWDDLTLVTYSIEEDGTLSFDKYKDA